MPTDPTVVAQLPSGVTKDSFSGYAGIDCVKLPDAALPNTWFVSTGFESTNNLKLMEPFFFLLALTNLSAAPTLPTPSVATLLPLACKS